MQFSVALCWTEIIIMICRQPYCLFDDIYSTQFNSLCKAIEARGSGVVG